MNCASEGSRLRAPFENLMPDDLRWSWGGDASAGEWLQIQIIISIMRLHLPMQGVWVWSLVGELRPHKPHGQKYQNIKQKQYCNKCNKKDFKNGPHQDYWTECQYYDIVWVCFMFGNCNHRCFCCGHPCTMLGVSLFISCKNKIQCVWGGGGRSTSKKSLKKKSYQWVASDS